MHVPIFNAKENGYFIRLLESGPNGGGAYINRYTLIMDLLVPGSLNWTALFNTDPSNSNDADWYLAPDGSIGIGALGYSAAGSVVAGTWYRLAFTADLGRQQDRACGSVGKTRDDFLAVSFDAAMQFHDRKAGGLELRSEIADRAAKAREDDELLIGIPLAQLAQPIEQLCKLGIGGFQFR